MKTVGSPVSIDRAVDTPPMSQRSAMANRGRTPMPACSAAWRDRGRSAGQIAPPGHTELDHDEALALVQVDGTGVHLAECPGPVDGAEEGTRCGIDDLVRLPPERPQVQLLAGRLPASPVQPCLPGGPNLALGQ